jgi:hypothetical protein
MLLNRNVNEGVSWNLPAISISFVINCNPPDLFLLNFLIADRCDKKKNKERTWIEKEPYYLFILLIITSKTVILNCVEFTTKI